MIKQLTMALGLIALTGLQAVEVRAEETATPQDVIAKVREAAAYLKKNGEAGLTAFKKADSPFVFKDTYVFVYNCDAGLADVATPIATIKVNKVETNADATGRVTGPDFCELAKRPVGGWIEYKWYKPIKSPGQDQLAYSKDIVRKVTLMLDVQGQPYQVGAGIYNDTASVKELDALLAE